MASMFVLLTEVVALDRAAFVREAARFKSNYTSINVPSRNEQVVQGAVQSAPAVDLPQVIAKGTYEAIINSSTKFEYCIVRLSLPTGVPHY